VHSPSIGADLLGVAIALVTIPLGAFVGWALSIRLLSVAQGVVGRIIRWTGVFMAAVLVWALAGLVGSHVNFQQNPPWSFGLVDGFFTGAALGYTAGFLLVTRPPLVGPRRPSPWVWIDLFFGVSVFYSALHSGLNIESEYRPKIAAHLTSLTPGLRGLLVVGGAFIVSFVYSHFVGGGIMNQFLRGLQLDWRLGRNRLYAFALLPLLGAMLIVLPYPGAAAGLGLRVLILLVAWRWSRDQPSGSLKLSRSVLAKRGKHAEQRQVEPPALHDRPPRYYWVFVGLLAAGAVLLGGEVVTHGLSGPATSASAGIGPTTTIAPIGAATVAVTGDGWATVTALVVDGQHVDLPFLVRLPWTHSVTSDVPPTSVVVTAQSESPSDSATISCSIRPFIGAAVAHTATGSHATVSCTWKSQLPGVP
jgi:hypothetical protein